MPNKDEGAGDEFNRESSLDDLAWCIGIIANSLDDFKDYADEVDEADKDGEEVDVTLGPEEFMALFHAHMIAVDLLFEAGVITPEDIEYRCKKIFGGKERLN